MANREKTLAELEKLATEPSFWNDQNKAKSVIDSTNQQRVLLVPFRSAVDAVQDIELLLDMAAQESDAAQRQHACDEAQGLLVRAMGQAEALQTQALMSGKLDSHGAYLNLHAGAGGTESCDWADMLLRMYRRFCESRGFTVDVLEIQAGEEAGIRSVSLLVSGSYAYGTFRGERGVHRLVRISPFDANHRRHTSFVALDVVAEIDDDIEVEVKEADLRVDTYRSGGAGGQHVNKTDSAVRITHFPSGIVVACQAERSQHKNRAMAMKMLKARLYELIQDQKKREMDRFYGKKGDIAWGNQIRSYVLQPYTLVKDHRTEQETSNVNAVLDGQIQPFIDAYLKWSVGGARAVDVAGGRSVVPE